MTGPLLPRPGVPRCTPSWTATAAFPPRARLDTAGFGSYNSYQPLGARMSTVGVKELKNRLTQYLRRTKHGEEVIVTERGRPIAVIQPIQAAARLDSREARLARLAAQGLLTLPTRKPLKRVRMAKASGRPLSQTIVEERR